MRNDPISEESTRVRNYGNKINRMRKGARKTMRIHVHVIRSTINENRRARARGRIEEQH